MLTDSWSWSRLRPPFSPPHYIVALDSAGEAMCKYMPPESLSRELTSLPLFTSWLHQDQYRVHPYSVVNSPSGPARALFRADCRNMTFFWSDGLVFMIWLLAGRLWGWKSHQGMKYSQNIWQDAINIYLFSIKPETLLVLYSPTTTHIGLFQIKQKMTLKNG